MNTVNIPDVVVLRLPLYVRILVQLEKDSVAVINSNKLGSLLQMTPAQIRKDLSYFGRFGKQGRGYNVRFLLEELRQILHIDMEWPSCLVGVGRLGQAIISYPGFDSQGFNIVAAFDSNPSYAGSTIGNLKVASMTKLKDQVTTLGIKIGIVAVPAEEAQFVIDSLVSAGVSGILNYAPVAPQVPSNVVTRNIDPVISLQSMPYYIPEFLD